MAKLGQQIQANTPQTILGRTERLRAQERAGQQNAIQDQAVSDAQSQLSKAQTVEEYDQIYQTLTPTQKSAFPTADDLRAQQKQQRDMAIGEINTNITSEQSELARKQAYVQEQRDKKSQTNKQSRQEQYDKNINSAEADIEYSNNKIRKLTEGLNRISAGENIEAVDVSRYASDYADYRQNVEKGKAFAREQSSLEGTKSNPNFTFTGVVKESFKGKEQGSKYFVGGTQVSQKNFMNQYDIYLEPSKQQPIKLIVAKGTDLNKLSQDEQSNRETSAQGYLSEFSQKVNAPTAEDNPSRLAKVGRVLKTVYTASPFGTGVQVDEGTNKARETGASRYLSLLTYSEASNALSSERKRKNEAQTQAQLIDELNKLVEGAPEDIRPEVQAYGFKLLQGRGITTIAGEDIGGDPGTVMFASEALKPSKSFDVYQIEKEDSLEKQALAGQKVPGIFINTAVSERFSVPTRSTIIQTGSYDPFSYQTNPSQRVTNVRKGLLYTRIFSTKASEVYGAGKVVELAGGALFAGGKYFYDALGGGARITELVVNADRTGVAILENAPKRSELLNSLIGKGKKTIVAGSLGLYGTQKVGSYLLEPRTPAEKKDFLIKAGAETFSISALIGEGAYNKAITEKANIAIARENERRAFVAEAKKLASQRAVAGSRSEIGFTEVGSGRTFFNQRTLESLGGQYAKLSGLSKEDSIQKIIEASVGKQTVVVGSALEGQNPTIFNRFSFASTTRDGQSAKTLTFDFNLDKAGVPRNLNVKATVAGENYAITNIFSKARTRPGKANIDEFKLRETAVSKLTDVTQADEGAKKITRYGVEDRLVKFKPYGNARLSGKEVLDLGFQKLDESYLQELFESATKTRKTGTFMNVRVEGQNLDEFEAVNLPNIQVDKGLTERTGALGQYNTRLNTVLIDENLLKNPKEFEEVLRHELGHASSIKGGAVEGIFKNRILKEPYTGKEVAVNPNNLVNYYKGVLVNRYGGKLPKSYTPRDNIVKEFLAETYGNTDFARTGFMADSFAESIPKKDLFFSNVPLDVGKEGEFVFLQKGVGKKSIATFNLKPEQYAGLSYFDNAVTRALRKKSGTFVVDDLVSGNEGQLLVSQQGTVQFNVGSQGTQSSVKLSDLGVQSSVPTVSPPAVRTPTRIASLKSIDNDLATLGTSNKSLNRILNGESQPTATRTDQRSRNALVNAVRQLLGQSQKEKQATRTTQKTSATQRIIQLQANIFKTPRGSRFQSIDTPTPSTRSKIDLPDFDKQLLDQIRGRVKRKKQKKELSYAQDFTSKILESPVQELTAKQIEKLVSKTQTGFEARAPVVLKGSAQARATKSLRKLLNQ